MDRNAADGELRSLHDLLQRPGTEGEALESVHTRGIGENDNRDIAKRIAELRLELAGLFGYPNYAAYVLEEKMAGNEATVDAFIDELLTATKGRALEEVAELQRYAVASGLYGAGFELMPWDWSYVSEKYKNDRYAVSNEEIKPYLELESVKQGIFSLAEKLYGITFVPNKEIPVYHPMWWLTKYTRPTEALRASSTWISSRVPPNAAAHG